MKTILCFLCLSFMGWICLLIGLVKKRRFRAKTASETAVTEGTIVHYETKRENWGKRLTTVYYPVVRFSAASHEHTAVSVYRFVEMPNEPPGRPPEGSAVKVYYDPSNPHNFHLETDKNDEGESMIRIGKYIIAFGASVSIICGLLLKW